MIAASARLLLLAAAGVASAQSSSSSPGGTSDESNATAPFPNTNYPGSEVPYTASVQANQTSPPKYPSPWMDGSGDWGYAYSRAQAFVKQMTLAEKVNITTGVGWQNARCVGETGGVPRLGFRSLCMQDAPVGIRFTDYNSVFPAGGTIAASWDRNLIFQRGFDMGSEHRMKGIDAQLGPVVGPLGRIPEGGRNWEGFSPDPVLSGIAVAESVRGIQSAGVMATTKHYILNEQEHFRQTGEASGYGYNITETLSSNIDDITMHELYLWPFADAVRAGTASVMCSYQQINNSYGCANSYTLNYLLKGELGFQGFVMSDWQAQHSGVGSALAGLDMAMPGDTSFNTGDSFWGSNLTIAVLNGTVPEWRIDDMATRILAAWYYVHRDETAVPINFDSWTYDTFGFEHFYTSERYGVVNEHVDVRQAHGADIRNMAAKSTVLLKNERNALPLSPNQQFTAVFGYDAGDNPWGPNGCDDRGCDNGTLAMAWGSGSANFASLVTPLAALQMEVLMNGNGVIQGMTDNWALTQAQKLARQATVALVFVNADSGEGFISVDGNEGDRQNLTLWHNGDMLIQNVSANCNNTIVVVHSTGPVLLTSFYENPNVTAIVWAGVPGEQSGNSIVDVLYGKVNPGGKLPFTLGKSRRDYGVDLLYQPNNGGGPPQDQFKEGVFIDYRHFDRANVTPIYEFGYGLSYTTFSLTNLQIQSHGNPAYNPTTGQTAAAPTAGTPGNASDYVFPPDFERVQTFLYPMINSTNLQESSGDPDYGQPAENYVPQGATDGSPQPRVRAGGAPGGNPGLWDVLFTVTCTVTNTGTYTGDEVPQVYVSLGGENDPKVVLRNFDRLTLRPGATKTFTAQLTRRDLSNWSPAMQDWYISDSPKTVFVGTSSRNLPLSAPLQIPPQDGSGAPPPSYPSSPSESTSSSSATPSMAPRGYHFPQRQRSS